MPRSRDTASNGADAFRGLAATCQEIGVVVPPKKAPMCGIEPNMTVRELLKLTKPSILKVGG